MSPLLKVNPSLAPPEQGEVPPHRALPHSPDRFWERPCTFELNQIAHWQIGSLGLWLARRTQEWRMVSFSQGDPHDHRCLMQYPAQHLPPDHAEVRRFSATNLGYSIDLGVRLADRRFVVRPESPFELLPRESVVLFIGSPLWVTVRDTLHSAPLAELPVMRPSDTWLGADLTFGSLAYAGRTLALLTLKHTPLRPGRAWTQLNLINRSDHSFALKRVVLPMPQLGLWQAEDDRLMTDAVTFVINDAHEGEVRIDSTPMGGARRLSEPREPPVRSGIRHALSLLFG